MRQHRIRLTLFALGNSQQGPYYAAANCLPTFKEDREFSRSTGAIATMPVPPPNAHSDLVQMERIQRENEMLKQELEELNNVKEQDLAGLIHYQDETFKLVSQRDYLIRQNFIHNKKINELEQRLDRCTQQMVQSHADLVALEGILTASSDTRTAGGRNSASFYHRKVRPRICAAKKRLVALGGHHVLDASHEVGDYSLHEFQHYEDMKRCELEDWYNSPQGPDPDTALI